MTVNELIEQLLIVQKMGMGECKVWYRDANDIDHEIEVGVYDNDNENLVLG